jgi:hypothetical protein
MIKDLVEEFAGRSELPIEVHEITTVVREKHYQDELFLKPVDAQSGALLGMFHQYNRSVAVYAEPVLVTEILYNKNVSVEWQRVVCCKELVHLSDKLTERVSKLDEVDRLVEKLLGPLSSEDYGFTDLVAAKDKLALYQCLPLLFPYTSVIIGREALSTGRKTLDEIADWAQVPVDLIKFMLDEGWDRISQELECI